jgi:hypothetical protein
MVALEDLGEKQVGSDIITGGWDESMRAKLGDEKEDRCMRFSGDLGCREGTYGSMQETFVRQ